MTFKKNLITAIATGAVLLNAIAPMAFAQDVTVTGNGEASTNTVTTGGSNTTAVTQTNNTVVTNTVNSSANTGGNTAYSNTGGSVGVVSGAANSSVDLSNKAGLNVANVSCNCNNSGTNVTVAGNGELSHNTVAAGSTNSTTLNQANNSVFTNTVNNSANTGGNTLSGNTGSVSGGSTFGVVSGPANAGVSISNMAGANFATVGSGTGTGNGSSVTIEGNGEASVNTVGLTNSAIVSLGQANNSVFTNTVNNSANTGGNVAFSNTGGSVLVGSGTANAGTDIMNAAGFNQASVDCGCLTSSLNVFLGGNGELSTNTVLSNPVSFLTAGQGNTTVLTSTGNTSANAGSNSALGNTGTVNGGSIFQVLGGSANQGTSVSNAGGVNIFGNGSLSMPTWLGGANVSTTFDLSSLWAWCAGLMQV